jgi:NAD(P)-dependent dehydrogenase (short-subunit alcohol dehydrogenase family)
MATTVSNGALRAAGKQALITGGGQGIGAAVSRMLARHGAKVTLTDLNLELASQVCAEINAELGSGTARALRQDVTAPSEWPTTVRAAAAAMGGLSVLVNNAGVALLGSVEDLSLEAWHASMSVNAGSIFLGCKHAIGTMRDSQPASIINIASISGLIAAHNLAGYNASKAAAWLLTKSVALHCAKQGLDIRCNSVHPAYVRTPLLQGLKSAGVDDAELERKLARQIPLGRLGEPDDVAYAVLYLASDESRFMTGAELKLDGGISAM